jgi:TRAP-type C4-dicarboxylate transport system substrate-binding protein
MLGKNKREDTNEYPDHTPTRSEGAASGALLLAAPAILTRRAQAAEFEFKLATTIIPEHPINAHARDAAAAILKESGGRVSIQIFPGYQLGSSTSMVSHGA